MPTINDSDSTINTYLDSAFPISSSERTAEDTFDPCPSVFPNYEDFPTFKTSYRNIDNDVICYNSKRPDWEPYDWFFSQIRWSHSDNNQSYSFCELAIAAHILTGGATSPSQDLYTKTKCMSLAFKRYYQKLKIDDLSYKSFFNPSNKVRTLSSIGSDNLLGVRRTPYFTASPDILKEVRLIAWKAVQHWQLSARIAKFGEGFQLITKRNSSWTPNSVIWIFKTVELNKQDKLARAAAKELDNKSGSVNLVSSGSPLSFAPVADITNKNAHISHNTHKKGQNNSGHDKGTFTLPIRSAKDTVCFYGHTVSSSTDYRGRQSWRVSPTPPWPSVPPDRPLCQKCFLFHYNAAKKGKSQYHFPQLYLYQRQNVNPTNSGGASSSTERPPG